MARYDVSSRVRRERLSVLFLNCMLSTYGDYTVSELQIPTIIKYRRTKRIRYDLTRKKTYTVYSVNNSSAYKIQIIYPGSKHY